MLVATILGLIFLVWYRTKSAWLIEILNRRVTRWRFVPQRLTKLVIGMLEQLSQALRVLVNVRELAVTIGWKIGRASCRERVWIAEGAGSVKGRGQVPLGGLGASSLVGLHDRSRVT